MNRRPKFWIHRNCRFWRGLFVLIFLFCCWIWSMFVTCKASYFSPRKTLAADDIGLGLESGCIRATWNHQSLKKPPVRASPPGSRWSFASYPNGGAILLPSYEQKTNDYGHMSDTFRRWYFPLWPPWVAWSIFWLYRMHRGDKRDDELYGGEDMTSSDLMESRDQEVPASRE